MEDYDHAVDIWGAGCTFAELLRASHPQYTSVNKVLFKGSSCFPISPLGNSDFGVNHIDDND